MQKITEEYLMGFVPERFLTDERYRNGHINILAPKDGTRVLGITFEEKAFFDVLTEVRDNHKFEYSDERCIELAKKIKLLIDDTAVYAVCLNNTNLRNKLASQLTVLIYKEGYPPEWDEEVFKKVLSQVENYKNNGTAKLKYTKLENVEDDKDVRHLIYNRLQMDANISDMELQREVIEQYGERYPDMSQNDWRHIIEDYTLMVREAILTKAKEISMRSEKLDMAAEHSIEENEE